MQIGIHHIAEFLSLLISIFCIRKLRNSFLIGYVPYLLAIFIIELYENYVYNTYGHSTIWLFNILIVVVLLFNAYISINFIGNLQLKKGAKILTIITTTLWIFYYLILFKINQFNNHFFAFTHLIQIVFGLFLFYDSLITDEENSSKVNSGLWLAAGLVIFNAGIAICFVLYDFIKQNQLKINEKYLYNIIPQYLSIILYSCIAISLIIWKKTIK